MVWLILNIYFNFGSIFNFAHCIHFAAGEKYGKAWNKQGRIKIA